jgi:spermidine dehydrogenase
MPISARARADLLRLFDPNQPDYLPGLSQSQKKEHLARISYKDYLLNVAILRSQIIDPLAGCC